MKYTGHRTALPCADCGHDEHDEWGCHHNLNDDHHQYPDDVLDCCRCDRYTTPTPPRQDAP